MEEKASPRGRLNYNEKRPLYSQAGRYVDDKNWIPEKLDVHCGASIAVVACVTLSPSPGTAPSKSVASLPAWRCVPRFHLICLKRSILFLVCRTLVDYFRINNIKVKGGPILHMLDYSPTETQKLLGNPDKSDNPTASSPACAGLAGEHCTLRTFTSSQWKYWQASCKKSTSR